MEREFEIMQKKIKFLEQKNEQLQKDIEAIVEFLTTQKSLTEKETLIRSLIKNTK